MHIDTLSLLIGIVIGQLSVIVGLILYWLEVRSKR